MQYQDSQLDAAWDEDFQVFDEIGAAFADQTPEEIDRETAKAVAHSRAELRAERETVVTRDPRLGGRASRR